MKLRNKRDTLQTYTKIPLLENLSISGYYNFLADSFQLSTIAIAARTRLLKNINIAANATLDPYAWQKQGYTAQGRLLQRRTPQYAWNKQQGIGQITQLNTSISIGLPLPKTKQEPKPKKKQNHR